MAEGSPSRTRTSASDQIAALIGLGSPGSAVPTAEARAWIAAGTRGLRFVVRAELLSAFATIRGPAPGQDSAGDVSPFEILRRRVLVPPVRHWIVHPIHVAHIRAGSAETVSVIDAVLLRATTDQSPSVVARSHGRYWSAPTDPDPTSKR